MNQNRLSQSIDLPDGRLLTYAEYGIPDSRPVFYFHGLSGSRLEPGVLNEETLIRSRIRLFAPDRPGMGGSTYQPDRGFSDWPKDVLALADQLGIRQFGVWGVSGGGGYAAACARWIPERLTAVVIVSGAGHMDSPNVRASMPSANRLMWSLAARSVRLMGLFLSIPKALQSDPEKIRQQMLRSLPPGEKDLFQEPGKLEAFIASGLESMRQGVRGVAWDTHLYAIPWDFRLEEICFPVHLLHGEADQNVPVEAAREVAGLIPGCQSAFYPGEGHMSLLAHHLDEIIAVLVKYP